MAYQYTLLRYVPDLVKGEVVNLAVVLLDEQGHYREARTAGEKEWRRLKWLHPAADLPLLRELLGQFAEAATWEHRAALDEMSASIRITPAKGIVGRDVDGLFERHVAAPPQAVRESDSTRVQLRRRVDLALPAAGL